MVSPHCLEALEMRYRFLLLLLLVASLPSLLMAADFGQRVEETWHEDVSRLNREIEQLKQEYRSSKGRAKDYKEEASWIHFRDHNRYRYLLSMWQAEEEHAEEVRASAETRIKQRNRILMEHDQHVAPEYTPW